MRDISVSFTFPPDFSVDFPWFILNISEDSPYNPPLFYPLCRRRRIHGQNSPQFPHGFLFHVRPKLPRGYPPPCCTNIALMYSEKRTSEKTQPWGLPVDVATLLDDIAEHLTVCCLWSKKQLTREMTVLLIFRPTMVLTRVGGSNVLNALLKSTKGTLR